jgi:predicted transcriptional regulator
MKNIIVHAKGDSIKADSSEYLKNKFKGVLDYHKINHKDYMRITNLGSSTAYTRMKNLDKATIEEITAVLKATGETWQTMITNY